MSVVLSCNNLQTGKIMSNTILMAAVYKSALGLKFELSSSALIVLMSLCYHYNIQRMDMFPKQQYILSKTGLSISSIKRGIKELVDKNLLVKTRTQSGNTYRFTQLFFESINLTPSKSQPNTLNSSNLNLLNNKHKNKTNNNNTNVIDITKEKSVSAIVQKLKDWGILDYKQIIKANDKIKILEIIRITENSNPKNKGAYFRSIINNQKELTIKKDEYNLKLQKMLSYKYWKHLPTGKIYMVKPDIGSHIYIQFSKKDNTVTMFCDNLTDNIKNFEPYIEKQNLTIDTKEDKPSKVEILKYVIEQNHSKEAQELARMFKINMKTD